MYTSYTDAPSHFQAFLVACVSQTCILPLKSMISWFLACSFVASSHRLCCIICFKDSVYKCRRVPNSLFSSKWRGFVRVLGVSNHRESVWWQNMAHYLTGIPASFLWYPSDIMGFFLINLFIYLCLHWVFVATRGFFSICSRGGYSSLRCAHFSLWWFLLLYSMDSRARAPWLWYMGLDASWHVGSSRTRGRSCVPCIGGWILNHWTTREVPHHMIFITLMIPCEVCESGTLPVPSL